MSVLSLYFGYGTGGHFLRGLRGARSSTIDPQRDVPGFPWAIDKLDSGLLKNRGVPDVPDGRVFWTLGYDLKNPLENWHAFFWWDRSGDSRPASNSGFYVRGFSIHERLTAYETARLAWPDVIERQTYSLVLQL